MKGSIENIRVLFEGWTKFLLATVRANGSAVDRLILDHGMAACVLPYNAPARTALLVTQLRAPLLYLGDESELLEAIAGRVDPHEEPAAAARREALEEAGLRLGDLEHVATCWPSPGVSTERIALYLGQYTKADRVAEGGGALAEHESLTIKEIPLKALAKFAAEGRLADMKTLALVQALQLRRPDLFR